MPVGEERTGQQQSGEGAEQRHPADDQQGGCVPATGEPRSTPNRYQSRVKAVISTITSGRAATPLV